MTDSLFCDLSKAFDCVPHKILKKLDYGLRGVPLTLMQSYFTNRQQFVDWQYKLSNADVVPDIGIVQCSILGPLLFLIFVNKLPSNLNCHSTQFADDTALEVASKDIKVMNEKRQNAYKQTEEWFLANKIVLNRNKTVSINFTASRRHVELQGGEVKYLGLTMDSLLIWAKHIELLCARLSKAIYAIRRIRSIINQERARETYFAMFHSVLSYGILAWGHSAHTSKVMDLQKKAVRAIEGVSPREPAGRYS
ncbi:uncharacterized protein LOC113380961 [Ctenocephalides felis]|uniref:uncharacterized protein LOC113380961 n=1 Tax=Ctenocephalides felis TaxID=7515 RepID=UPI000E6E2353|nr:uncharacterized protein LOC113380961 [Ctenocephalides felis]